MTNIREASSKMRILLVTIPAAIFQRVRDLDFVLLTTILIGTLLIAGISTSFNGGYYLGKWLAIGWAVSILIGILVYKKTSLSIACLLTYLLCNAAWIMSGNTRYDTVNTYDLMAIKYYASESTAKLLLLVLPFMAIEWDFWNYAELLSVGKFLTRLFCIVSLLEIFWEWHYYGCSGVNTCGGALRNPSLNSSMMATALPLLTSAFPFGWVFIVPVALASMLGKTAIGIGMCALYAGFLLWPRLKRQYKVPVTLIVSSIFLLSGYISHGEKPFFNSSARFSMWQFFMNLWAKNNYNIGMGTGFGTFGVFSINLQKAFNLSSDNWWVWLHNDWLQMAFEGGVIALALMVWVYLDCAKKLYDKKMIPELHSLLLLGVMMGVEYGLHIAPVCLFAGWLVAISLLQVKRSSSILADEE